MRFIAAIAALTLCRAAIGTEYAVFIRLGQSNAALRGNDGDIGHPWHDELPTHKLCWRTSTSEEGWGAFRLDGHRFGTEASFVRAYEAAHPSAHIAYLIWVENGSGAKQWVNTLDATAAAWVDGKLAELTAAGDTYTIAGVVWHQGCAECKPAAGGGPSTQAPQWESRVRTLIGRWQTRWNPTSIVLVKVDPLAYPPEIGKAIVRAAADEIAGDTPGVLTVDAAGLPLVADLIHLDSEAIVTLGEMIAGVIP